MLPGFDFSAWYATNPQVSICPVAQTPVNRFVCVIVQHRFAAGVMILRKAKGKQDTPFGMPVSEIRRVFRLVFAHKV